MLTSRLDERIKEKLLRDGEVLLASRKEIEEGKDRIAAEPAGEKIADVKVKLQKKISLDPYGNRKAALHNFLKTYGGSSGFDGVSEWVDRVKDRNGELPEKLFLYKLELEEEHLAATRWYELNRPEELPRSEAGIKEVMKEILDRRGVPEEYRKYFQRLADVDGWEGVDFLMATSNF